MPFDMIGEHAQEDVSAYPFSRPVTDRSDLEIDGLQAAEGACDPREVLVGLHRLVGVEMLCRHAGADDIDPIKAGLFGDALGTALEREMAVADRRRSAWPFSFCRGRRRPPRRSRRRS